ncbi:MAG: fused MFS/spermidine synthase [Myxococcota bacterium]
MPRRRGPSIAVLLFLSGFCALIYQVAWLRELRLVFGASTPANAAVLAVFMGGLGFGSLLLSRRAERSARPLLLYANLEILIAVTAAISPGLLMLARSAYIAAGGATTMGLLWGTVVRLGLSALVLLPPTLLMGGTLPAAAKAAIDDRDLARRSTARLYGANALGAVFGAGLATFVLLEVFGIRLTLWMGCALNALVGLAARAMARSRRRAAPRSTTTTTTRVVDDDDDDDDATEAEDGADAPRAAGSAPVAFVLAAAGVTGFVFLLLELVWYRMLAPLLGGSTYTFGLILTVALLGIGIGGLMYTRRDPARRPTLGDFAASCGLEAVFIAIPFALGDHLAVATLVLRGFGYGGLWGHALGWTVITAVVALPAAIVAGYQFPLLIALLGRGRAAVSRHVGVAYATNTLGSILGSLAGGFILLPWLTAPGAWKLTVAALILTGAAAWGFDLRERRPEARRRTWRPLVAALAAVALMTLPEGPTAVWRHSPIGAGRADGVLAGGTRTGLQRWMQQQRAATTWEVDGRESSLALATLNDTAFVVSGKSDGAAVEDSATQVMSGLLGALLHPDVKRVMVIGLGTGSTAGWLAALPGVERVDVVEIEPQMLEVARRCRAVNQGVLDNPKVNVIFGDAREVLLTSRETYDLVFSEPSNPYRAGIASLFTHEFYQAVARRLRPGGMLVQWAQTYEIDVQSLQTVFTTLSQTFASVEAWRGDVSDMLLVSRREDVTYDVATIRAKLQEPIFRDALMWTWRAESLEDVLAHFVASSGFARAVAAEAGALMVNTDDLNLLEFGVARALGRPQNLTMDRIVKLALERGHGRAPIRGESIDWDHMLDAYVALNMAPTGAPSATVPPVSNPSRNRLGSALQAWTAGDYARARAAWEAREQAPRRAVELMTAGAAYAEAADADRALPMIAELRDKMPAEADVIEARLRLRTGDHEGAATALIRAFEAYRTFPFASNLLMQRATQLAPAIARANRSLVPSLDEALAQPFATNGVDLARRLARADVAMLDPNPSRCVAAMRDLEPHVPWREAFLRKRVACYNDAGASEAGAAQADLARFYEDRGRSVEVDLLPPPAPASSSRATQLP